MSISSMVSSPIHKTGMKNVSGFQCLVALYDSKLDSDDSSMHFHMQKMMEEDQQSMCPLVYTYILYLAHGSSNTFIILKTQKCDSQHTHQLLWIHPTNDSFIYYCLWLPLHPLIICPFTNIFNFLTPTYEYQYHLAKIFHVLAR